MAIKKTRVSSPVFIGGDTDRHLWKLRVKCQEENQTRRGQQGTKVGIFLNLHELGPDFKGTKVDCEYVIGLRTTDHVYHRRKSFN